MGMEKCLEMFKTANPAKDSDYKSIYLKVSQLDSPVLNPLPKLKHAAAKVNDDNPKMEPSSPILDKSQRRRPMLTAARSKLSSRFLDGIDDEDEDEEYYDRLDSTQDIPATVTSLSPLERYMKKLEENKRDQELKVANLKNELRTVDEKLQQAKSKHEFVQGNVCGNCHVRLGHKAKKCELDQCMNVYDCGIEKFHPRQTNRSKLRQGIQKAETKLKKLKQEVQNRQSSIESLKKSLVNQVEPRLLAEHASDYYVGGLRNSSLLRQHVHIIESCRKRNFNVKIPQKQNV